MMIIRSMYFVGPGGRRSSKDQGNALAAILVLAVNSIIGLKVMNDGGGLRDFIPGRGLAAARPKPAGSFIAQRPSSENQSDLSDLPDLSDV